MKKFAMAVIYFILLIGLVHSSAWAVDPIKIGIMLPLTGRQATLGRIQQNAALMAADEINAAGGVKGKKVELVIADTQGNPDAGRAVIEKLIRREQVPVIGGGFSNSATWATIGIAQQNKIPFLVNSAAADKITEQGWEYIFRLGQPASEHFETFASFATGVAADIQSVALVHDDTLTGASEARKFFKTAQGLSLKLAARESYERGKEDFGTLLGRIKTQSPDLVYLVAEDVRDAAALTRQCRQLKLEPKLSVGAGSGFTHAEFVKNAGKAAEHLISLVPWTASVPYPGAGQYSEKFIATYHMPPGHHGAEAYAGMQVIGAALKRASALHPKAVRDALAATDLMTVIGPVRFTSYGNKTQQNKLPTLLVQWIDGKQEIIWPQSLATKKTVYPAPGLNEREAAN